MSAIHGNSNGGGKTVYKVGDVVYVKLINKKITSTWPDGKVTCLVSNITLDVDGVNRYVTDIRLAPHSTGEASLAASDCTAYLEDNSFDFEIELGGITDECRTVAHGQMPIEQLLATDML